MSESIGIVFQRRAIRKLCGAFRRRALRSLRQFAEDEITIPNGPYMGQPFRTDRQPVARHWFNEWESGRWSEIVALGPTQTGKTLLFFILPILYFLFELCEDVIAAVPDMTIASDKWEADLLPMIERTAYRTLLPRTGKGSRGGLGQSMMFTHGPRLRWMTGGPSDKSRSHYTSRNIVFSETDALDVAIATSVESTQISQIEQRAEAWPERERRILKECTVSHESKHTWSSYVKRSSRSRILLPCPKCGEFVLPERENFIGWQDAGDEIEARQKARLYCPTCGEEWEEWERRAAAHQSVIVHGEQQVSKDGVVSGPMPRTTTLGIRWTCVHNCLTEMEDVAASEFRASRADNPDLAERAQRQFVWVIPTTSDVESLPITATDVQSRKDRQLTKGVVPGDAVRIGFGCDWGKRLAHWVALAERADGSFHVFDYGRVEVPSDDFDFEQATRLAMAEVYDIAQSFGRQYTAGVDCRWKTDEVLAAVRGLKSKDWYGHEGLGDQHFTNPSSQYEPPVKVGGDVIFVSQGWYLKRRDKVTRDIVAYVDACAGKLAIQNGFHRLPKTDRRGVFTLFGSSDANEHVGFSKHIVAETVENVFKPGKGFRSKWTRKQKANHWLDASYIALTACKVGEEMAKLRAKKLTPRAAPVIPRV